MAQVMQWPPAIRNYMRKVRLKYQHVPPTQYPYISSNEKKPMCQGSDCIYRLGTCVIVCACVLIFFVFKLAVSDRKMAITC